MQNVLSIELYNNPTEAPNYNEIGGFASAKITKALIVGKGTVNNNATVDLQIVSEDGQKFVVMLTGGLIKNLAAAIQGVEARG